jgi:NAD(P)H-nitrite reductase large subunit
MPKHHLIIGGGPAATNAAETIREFEPDEAQITLVCDEPAHSRMALPYWLSGQVPREHTHTGDADYFQRLNVDARIGRRVSKIDDQGQSVTLDNGQRLPFDRLLIATGSSPLDAPFPGADLPGVHPLWSLADTGHVLAAAAQSPRPRVVLIGAGFVGFIVLNAMFKRGWQLTVIEREQRVLPRMLDEGAAGLVESWLDARGVGMRTQSTVQAILPGNDGEKLVQLQDGSSIPADIVIVATGVKPNVGVVAGTAIAIEHGILVDHHLQTSVPGIYAAGDVAQGPVLFHADKQIHAIQTTAVDHGRVAGANMAGHAVRYPGSLLMNVVDVCGLQCTSFGHWNDPQAEAMTICSPQGWLYRKLLWRDDQLVGAIFAGRPHDVGMLTDVGMVKGILQTQTAMGPWKDFLRQNPFDIRRAYVAASVAQKLVGTTLLGRPTRGRQYRFGNAQASVPENRSHLVFVDTHPDKADKKKP